MTKLKKAREKAGLSQSQLAAKSDTNIYTIQEYEKSRRNINGAKLETLAKMSVALECPISDIITDEQLIELLKKVTL